MDRDRALILKLQQAINFKGSPEDGRIAMSTSQFYIEERQRMVTVYTIYKNVYADGRVTKTELFHSSSQIQVLLFLRDYYYKMTGQEIPNDNEKWNEIKRSKGIEL